MERIRQTILYTWVVCGAFVFLGSPPELSAFDGDSVVTHLSCTDERSLFAQAAPSNQEEPDSIELISMTGPHDPEGWCYKTQDICTLFPAECHVNTVSVISNVKGDPAYFVTGVGGGYCGWKTCSTPPWICGCGSRVVSSVCE